jgi:hypothetical protein
VHRGQLERSRRRHWNSSCRSRIRSAPLFPPTRAGVAIFVPKFSSWSTVSGYSDHACVLFLFVYWAFVSHSKGQRLPIMCSFVNHFVCSDFQLRMAFCGKTNSSPSQKGQRNGYPSHSPERNKSLADTPEPLGSSCPARIADLCCARPCRHGSASLVRFLCSLQ